MRKILIVDDDAAIVESTQMLLEMEGYDVATSLGDNVFGLIDNHNPDLILLDIWMSGQNGLDIAQNLKSQPKTSQIPIVMISANRDAAQLAQKSGANDFLSKPFEIDDLIKIVKKNLLN